MVAGDVKCYHCGYISGELIAENAHAEKAVLFRPAKDHPGPIPKPGDVLRCGRCGGPVFLDDKRTIRPRRPEPAIQKRQRRKWTRRALAKVG